MLYEEFLQDMNQDKSREKYQIDIMIQMLLPEGYVRHDLQKYPAHKKTCSEAEQPKVKALNTLREPFAYNMNNAQRNSNSNYRDQICCQVFTYQVSIISEVIRNLD